MTAFDKVLDHVVLSTRDVFNVNELARVASAEGKATVVEYQTVGRMIKNGDLFKVGDNMVILG